MKYLKLFENFLNEHKILTEEEFNTILNDYKYFDTYQYNSFNLSEDDLKNIAIWGLLYDFQSSGAWINCADNKNENLFQAVDCILEDFHSLLKDSFPLGFHGIPDIVPIYRFVRLFDKNRLNKERLGQSWFTNLKQPDNREFFGMLQHLLPYNNDEGQVYLIFAQVNIEDVDITRSLWQRSLTFNENELVTKSNANIHFIKMKKYEGSSSFHF
jgi:hypothetical protein